MSAKAIIKEIKKYSRFLVTSHIDVEADALGSELALTSLLRKLGKSAFIVNVSPTPAGYKFLPGVKKIFSFSAQDVKCYQRLNSMNFEAVCVIDCSTRQRIGHLANLLDNDVPIINVDHHLDNTNFGRANWVDFKASSAGEMVYHLFKAAGVRLDRNDALNIYTAILTDTGSFRHANTRSSTLKISGELLKFGIEPDKVYAQVYENSSVQDMAIIIKIISTMRFAAGNKLAWIEIGQREFNKIKGKPEILDRILDFAKLAKTVKVVIMFCQLNQRLTKLSLRSKSPIDVQKIAKGYGGGGHKRAAGCIVKGSLKRVEQKVLRRIKKLLL